MNLKSMAGLKEGYSKAADKIEKYLIALIISFFIGGIFFAKYLPSLGTKVSGGISGFVSVYAYVAPLAIFIILAPSLAKILSDKSGKFGMFALKWLAAKRAMACIFGIIFTAIVFKLPFYSSVHGSFMAAVLKALITIGKMLYSSPYMIAIWLGIAAAFISLKVKWLFGILDKTASLLEKSGEYFVLLIPLFMFAIGAYIYNLPLQLNGLVEQSSVLKDVSFFGISFGFGSASGAIAVYSAGALLVGIACFIWHFMLLFYTKYIYRGFSIRAYFKKYWLKVYPLLWATSSEALATPLNLYLTKKNYPEIRDTVRRFVVGFGSYLNIDGTIICVFVLGGMVTAAMGINPSVIELLFAVPIVFLLGYAIPGIPGELILFAGPLALLLNIPLALVPVFLALYVGLQIGLPDSFRTGANSTDNCACALLLNKIYERRFSDEKNVSIWEVIHSIPGRVRVTHPFIYEGNEFNEHIAEKMLSRGGIHKVNVNPETGTLLIHYDTNKLNEGELLSMLDNVKPPLN